MVQLADKLAELTVSGASDQELRAAATDHHKKSWEKRSANTIAKRESELLSGDTGSDTVYSNPNLPSPRINNLFNWSVTKARLKAKKEKGIPVNPEDIEL